MRRAWSRRRAGARGAPAIASRAVRFLIASLLVCAAGATRVVAQSGGPLGTAQLQISGARLTLGRQLPDDRRRADDQRRRGGARAHLLRLRRRVRLGPDRRGARPHGRRRPVGTRICRGRSRTKTAPGGTFFLPGFQREGDYLLSNIRLVETATGRVLANAEPSLATLHVRQILLASASVTRLTLADLQARGITITQQDFNAFTVRGGIRVLGDHREHRASRPLFRQRPRPAARQVDREARRAAARRGSPPSRRWQPPNIVPFRLSATAPRTPSPDGPGEVTDPEFPLYGAIILPGSVSFLNQFFDAKIIVANGAPNGSGAHAAERDGRPQAAVGRRPCASPQPFRPSPPGRSCPSSRRTGWERSARRSRGPRAGPSRASCLGTHVLKMEIEADLARPGRPILSTGGVVQAAVEVVDARFQLAFNHPDVVRTGEPYSLYVTVTNLSRAAQNLVTRGPREREHLGRAQGRRAGVLREDDPDARAGSLRDARVPARRGRDGHVRRDDVPGDGRALRRHPPPRGRRRGGHPAVARGARPPALHGPPAEEPRGRRRPAARTRVQPRDGPRGRRARRPAAPAEGRRRAPRDRPRRGGAAPLSPGEAARDARGARARPGPGTETTFRNTTACAAPSTAEPRRRPLSGTSSARSSRTGT